MTQQHTPGPWHVDMGHIGKEQLKGRLQEAVFTESGEFIALFGENRDNANLVAAAPDFYWASHRNLQIMRTMLEYLRLCNPDSVHTVTLEGQIKETESAIAKARGQV